MRPREDTDVYRDVNDANTVGICPVKNAAGQRPVALLQADFLEYAAKLARTEYGSPIDVPAVYLWSMDFAENCNWIAMSRVYAGQYPDEAIVLAGRIDDHNEIVP